jgi:DNA polymerase III delta prime subunit
MLRVNAKASSSHSICCASATNFKRSTIWSRLIALKSTTEPHKIPPTIISRAQRFDFKAISLDQIVERLKFGGILCGSVVANIKIACAGGSSNVFKRALKAPVVSPPTIISRAQRFDFKAISLDQIVERLKFVADAQQIDVVP